MKFAGANAYTGRHPNDVIYYLLAFCKELGYDSRNVKVSITGHSPMLAELNMLDGYFDRVSSIAQYPKVMLFSYQLISHRSEYFSLFNLGASATRGGSLRGRCLILLKTLGSATTVFAKEGLFDVLEF